MNNIEEFVNIFHLNPAVISVFIILFALDTMAKILKDSWAHLKIIYKRIKNTKAVKNTTGWIEQQNVDTLKIKTMEERQADTEESLLQIKDILVRLTEQVSATQEAMKAMEWDRISHFGMIHITRGHITNSDKHIMLAEYDAYHSCNGNGHITAFMECVNKLPLTELLSEQELNELENDEDARDKRVREAKLALYKYYELEEKNGLK